MDDLSFVVQSIIDNELDDLLLDLVYELHSSLKGIPEDQLELNSNGPTKTRQISSFNSPSSSTAIEKHTCTCPHCGQGNIIAIRFAYHLAKCLGVGRRSSRQAKNRIVDQVLTITASSDDSRSNGDDCQNGDPLNPSLPEDAGSCTDSTSSSSNNHRRLNQEDQDYRGDFDEDEEEDDWKPQKKKRRTTTTNNPNLNHLNPNKTRKKTKKEEILRLTQPTSQSLNELDFHNCIIPLDKLCPRTQHVVIPLTSSSTSTSSIDEILLKSRHVSSTVSTRSSSPTLNCSSHHYFVRSPLNLVEDDQSSTTSIIRFKEDNKR